MKKIFSAFVIAVCCMFMAMPAQAQLLKWGVKGGVNMTKIDWDGGYKGNKDNSTGFFIGPMAEFTIPIVGLGVDVAALYNQSGAKAQSGNEEVSQTFKSIEVPVNLKWTLGLGSTLGAYIAAGPQFGFNVGSGHFTESFDMKSCNTSFNVGAGVKLLGHLQAGVNYNFGLSKMARSVDDQMTIEMKRNTWQISLAYMF